MNIFSSKIYTKQFDQMKRIFVGDGRYAKQRNFLIFSLIGVFMLICGLLFFLQDSDKFSSVNEELEMMDVSDLPLYIKHDVPFTSQAPSRQWQDKLYQDACEETVIIIATHWIAGDKDDIGVGQAEIELEKLFNIVEDKYGTAIDMSAEDTAKLLSEYSGSDNVKLVYDMDLEDILRYLADGSIVIVPSDGEWLDNKYFAGTGPERHMVVIVGYDYKKGYFITNDPGTNKGKDFRYSFDNLMSSIRNYYTGDHISVDDDGRRVMIVVGK